MRSLGGMVVLVALLSGCSGGDGLDTSHDQDHASAAVLKAGDLEGFDGGGSSNSTSSSSSSDDPVDECIKQATGLDTNAVEKDRTATANATFHKGAGATQVTINAGVDLLKSSDALSRQIAAMSKSEVNSCLKDGLARTLEGNATGATVVDPTLSYKPLTGIGDEGAELDMTATLSAPGHTLAVAVEIDFVRKGRAGINLLTTATNGAPDHAVAVSALTTMLSRLKQ